MRRSHWVDVAIAVAIVALAAVGAWALWWDDVRAWRHPSNGSAAPIVVKPQT